MRFELSRTQGTSSHRQLARPRCCTSASSRERAIGASFLTAEQRAIAAFLDRETGRVDRLVAKKRELIERLKEKRTALISRTVTRGLPPAAARAAGLPENPPLKPSGLDWLGDIPSIGRFSPFKRVAQTFPTAVTPDDLTDRLKKDGTLSLPNIDIEGTLNFDDVPFARSFPNRRNGALVCSAKGDTVIQLAKREFRPFG